MPHTERPTDGRILLFIRPSLGLNVSPCINFEEFGSFAVLLSRSFSLQQLLNIARDFFNSFFPAIDYLLVCSRRFQFCTDGLKFQIYRLTVFVVNCLELCIRYYNLDTLHTKEF